MHLWLFGDRFPAAALRGPGGSLADWRLWPAPGSDPSDVGAATTRALATGPGLVAALFPWQPSELEATITLPAP